MWERCCSNASSQVCPVQISSLDLLAFLQHRSHIQCKLVQFVWVYGAFVFTLPDFSCQKNDSEAHKEEDPFRSSHVCEYNQAFRQILNALNGEIEDLYNENVSNYTHTWQNLTGWICNLFEDNTEVSWKMQLTFITGYFHDKLSNCQLEYIVLYQDVHSLKVKFQKN